jgi:hypothetical protein
MFQDMTDEEIVGAIDKLVAGVREVISDLSPAERERLLRSIRAVSSDIADRLEAPSNRNHQSGKSRTSR